MNRATAAYVNLTGKRSASIPQNRLPTTAPAASDVNAAAATVASMPWSLKNAAWWMLTLAWTKNMRPPENPRIHSAGVRIASRNVQPSDSVDMAACGRSPVPVLRSLRARSPSPSGFIPMSSGLEIIRSHIGARAMTHTLIPSQNQASRHPTVLMSTWAKSGMRPMPTECVEPSIPLARPRRRTNH